MTTSMVVGKLMRHIRSRSPRVSLRAVEFYLTCVCKWKPGVELTGPNGQPLGQPLSDEERRSLRDAILAASVKVAPPHATAEPPPVQRPQLRLPAPAAKVQRRPPVVIDAAADDVEREEGSLWDAHLGPRPGSPFD